MKEKQGSPRGGSQHLVIGGVAANLGKDANLCDITKSPSSFLSQIS